MATVQQDQRPYYRGDQASGITGPNLAKNCTFAEHICRARGKRTQFTSISLEPNSVRDFGDIIYKLRRPETDADGHQTIEHEALLESPRGTIKEAVRAERQQAILALRRASLRREGLIRWQFQIPSNTTDLITWAEQQVQPYFPPKSRFCGRFTARSTLGSMAPSTPSSTHSPSITGPSEPGSSSRRSPAVSMGEER